MEQHYMLPIHCHECRRSYRRRPPHLLGVIYVNAEEQGWRLHRRRFKSLSQNTGEPKAKRFVPTRSHIPSDPFPGGPLFFMIRGDGMYPDVGDSDQTTPEYHFTCKSRHHTTLTRGQIDTVVARSIAGTLDPETVWARPRRRKPLNL